MTGSESTPQYTPILAPKHIVTGVRGWTDPDVILTGSIVGEDNATSCMIYVGPLPSTGSGTIYTLEPAIYARKVTTSTFYGPDTYVSNPSLGDGNIRAVGTYQFQGSQTLNHGMIYHGKPNGDGYWEDLDFPDEIAGSTVLNTMPHSTMGDIVVGNYDLEAPDSARAFICHLPDRRWTILDLLGCTLTTAYGVWQNGKGSSRYTIVGGAKDGDGINQGFIVDYDSKTGALGLPTFYRNPDDPVVLTHFEGITEAAEDGGFNLAGQAEGDIAMFATVRPEGDGYGPALWFPFSYTGANQTTGNTVYDNILMGIFTIPDSPVQSYAATFEPERRGAGRRLGALARAAAARR